MLLIKNKLILKLLSSLKISVLLIIVLLYLISLFCRHILNSRFKDNIIKIRSVNINQSRRINLLWVLYVLVSALSIFILIVIHYKLFLRTPNAELVFLILFQSNWGLTYVRNALIFIFFNILWILIEKILMIMNLIWHYFFILITIFFINWNSLIFFLKSFLVLKNLNLLLKSL